MFTAWGSITAANRRVEGSVRAVFYSKVNRNQTITANSVSNRIVVGAACCPDVFGTWGSVVITNTRANGIGGIVFNVKFCCNNAVATNTCCC